MFLAKYAWLSARRRPVVVHFEVTLRCNTVIKDDNLDQLLPIVERAATLGCGVNFSVYTDAKNGNARHLVRESLHAELDDVVHRLLAYKRRRRGVITNSDAYLELVP